MAKKKKDATPEELESQEVTEELEAVIDEPAIENKEEALIENAEVEVPEKTVRIFMKESSGRYQRHIRYGVPESVLPTLKEDSYTIIG
jgi:hypothetical protein